MKLIILGAGGYGQTIADIAEQLGYEVSFLDDNSDKSKDTLYKAMDTFANFSRYICDDICFYPAFGNNEVRVAWLERLTKAGCDIPTIIHPTAYVSPKARVFPGTAILPGAIVKADNHLPRCLKVEAGTVIGNREYK